jgi:ubiquinone/menaquinone biosynthesis C-methylase UbiE
MTTLHHTDHDLTPELKAKHRAMWAFGDYPSVSSDLIPELGEVLTEACRIRPGEHVLDIAAGTGNASIPAARRGAHVVASDLTPELLEHGRARAGDLDIEWRTADAEALPFEDASFDVAMSSVGIMFAPHHQRSADELVRVVRPGGRIGLVSWTPEGFIGQMFAIMKPYVAPPPAGVSPPPLWGQEAHVRELLGDRVRDVDAQRRMLPVRTFTTGAEFRDYFKANYGPTIAAYKGIADQPEKVAALDEALAELGDRQLSDGTMDWEYLLFTATRS